MNLFLILIKVTGSKFYASRKVILTFQSKIDSLLETHTPLKKLKQQKGTRISHQTMDYIRFITIIIRFKEISYPCSSKGQKEKYFTNFFN